MASWTADAAVGASVLLVGISLALMILGFVAARRVGTARLGFVATAFGAMAAMGLVLASDAYNDRAAIAAGTVAHPLLLPLLGLLVVLLLYVAVLKR